MSSSEAAQEEVVESPDITFEPLVKLAPVSINTLEDNENECFKMRAKLFRFASENDPPEWKERGVGELKLLQHKLSGTVRLLMRRDKTHKICANHFLTKEMKLVPSMGSDRAFVWTVLADFADEEPRKEQLAIRLKNAENAQKFKAAFEKCQKGLPNDNSNKKSEDDGEDQNQEEEKDKEDKELAETMDKMTVSKETGEKESSQGQEEQCSNTSKKEQEQVGDSKKNTVDNDKKEETAKPA